MLNNKGLNSRRKIIFQEALKKTLFSGHPLWGRFFSLRFAGCF